MDSFNEALPAISAVIAVFAAHIIGRLAGYREAMKDAKAIYLADRDDQPTTTAEGD